MIYLGDFAEDATVTFTFCTNAADGGRESFSASLEEADIVIFKGTTAMTLDASTITITTDTGSRTGVHTVSVDMSNDADFTTGSDYHAVLYASDETLDSQAPAGTLACWSCENRSVNVARISGSSTAADNAEVVFDTDFATNYNATRNAWATNVQDTVGTGNLPADVIAVSGDTTAANNLELDYDGTGYSKANSTIGTCTVNTDMRGTDSAATATALATVDGNVDSILTNTGELQADLTDGGRLDLLIDAIKAKTDNLPASPAAVGSAMTLADGAITAAKIAANAISAAKIADDAITSAKLAADSIGSSQLATSAVSEIQSNLATAAKMLAYVQLLARKDAAIAADNSVELGEINADGGSGAGGFDNTTDAAESVRDRGDSAWITATGFSTLDAAGVRTAVGLASANLDTQLAATKTVADAILVDTAEIGAAGAGLSDIPWNASWDAEVQSECTDALNAYDPPTRAELTTDINSVLAKSLAYTQLIVRSDAAIATDNATELTAINADGGSGAGGFSNQTDSVQAIRDRGDTAWTTGAGGSAPSAASIADAVWDEARADHTTAGTFGEHTGDAAMRGTNSAALASVATEARLAELDAANLPADVDSLLTRIPAALFSGITSLAGWLRLSLRSDAAATTDEATSLSEINADGGSGAGDYAATTDSQEATRDRGDAAWTTGVGGSSAVVGSPSKSGGKQ